MSWQGGINGSPRLSVHTASCVAQPDSGEEDCSGSTAAAPLPASSPTAATDPLDDAFFR